MNEKYPVLLMNIDGILYPVGMTPDQVSMFRLFVAGLSKEKELSILTKAPVIEAYEIANKVNENYAVDIVK